MFHCFLQTLSILLEAVLLFLQVVLTVVLFTWSERHSDPKRFGAERQKLFLSVQSLDDDIRDSPLRACIASNKD